MAAIRPLLLIAGCVLFAALLVATVHLSANNLEFSRYNSGWNGTSSFFAGPESARMTEILSPDDLAGYKNGAVLVIIAPDHAPTRAESAAYASFLSRGNTILLLDDFGHGNQILENIGSGIVLLPGNLSSIDREYSDPYSVVVYPAGSSRYLRAPAPLLLNIPAAIEGGKTLALTSIFSWIDTRGDRKINGDEPFGQFSVMAEEKIGGGTVVVISDPSILVNSMYDLPDRWGNRHLIAEIANSTSPVLLDQMNTRTDDTEGLSAILHVIRTTLMYKLILLCILLLGTVMVWRRYTR